MHFLLTEIHFILSKRGQNLLVYKQYTFAKNCVSKAKTSWTCSSRRSKNCKAQVVLTNDGELIVINEEHNHSIPVFYMNNTGNYVRIPNMENAENTEKKLFYA